MVKTGTVTTFVLVGHMRAATKVLGETPDRPKSKCVGNNKSYAEIPVSWYKVTGMIQLESLSRSTVIIVAFYVCP